MRDADLEAMSRIVGCGSSNRKGGEALASVHDWLERCVGRLLREDLLVGRMLDDVGSDAHTEEDRGMNDAMRRFEGMVGEWDLTLTHAWFLDSMETEIHGSATIEWLGDAFLVLRSRLVDDSTFELVVGRNDARDQYVTFSHDSRGVYRVFNMAFEDGAWTLLREDPDFHQRLVMRVEADRIEMRADASEDAGETWRKDLDYILVRRAQS